MTSTTSLTGVALPAATAALLLSACSLNKPQPPAVDTSGFSKKEWSVIHRTPVIDVHTHTFNARCLPIRNIALGKRDALGPLSIFVTDRATLIVVAAILHATEPLEAPKPLPSDQEIADEVSRISKGRQVSAQEVAENAGVRGLRKLIGPQNRVKEKDLEPDERRELRKVAKFFTDNPGIATVNTEKNDEIQHFLYCLTSPAEQMESLFQSDHTDKSGRRAITLSVSHMMDMGPTYDEAEDLPTRGDIPDKNAKFYDFRRIQIPLMERQQRAANGRQAYFVAYNPFRDTWKGDPLSKEGEALRIVQDAYLHRGAFGVKIYPPSGYTPTGNRIPFRPWSIAWQPRQQWHARYEPGGQKLSPADLDRRLLELLTWAAKNGVPIFAHCGQGEFEARHGYHNLADPKRWLKLMQDHPELHDLHLCLAHAGGGDDWYGTGSTSAWIDATWGGAVYQLCRDYPHVYCDFACQDSIADPELRKHFVKRLQDLITLSRQDGKPWDFSDKIMYGSDWFMPMTRASDRLNFVLAFQSAIYTVGGDEAETVYKKFFYRNALEYLNARKRLQKGGLPLPLRAQLQVLLERK